MKRTNLIIDEELLKEAKRLLGSDSYSAAVNHALAEAIRLCKVRGLADLFGSGIWSGDLAEMRRDPPKRKRAKNRG